MSDTPGTPGWSAPGGQEPPPQQPGWQQPGWQQPGSQPPPGWQQQQQPPVWGQPPPPGWGWGQPRPDVKPGVVALRPLGVGELLDGAVASLRENPAAMLGISALVAVVVQVVETFALWLFVEDLNGIDPDSTVTADQAEALLGAGLLALGISAIVAWLASIFLTGMLTVVVSRAVLGRKVSPGEAWRAARGRLPKLVLLTVLVSLITLSPFLITTVLIVGLVLAGAEGAALAVTLLFLLAIPLAVWIYVRLALSTPAFMLETTGGRPATIRQALRRSSQLVRGSWWRTFGVLLLGLILTGIISGVVTTPVSFLLPELAGDAFINADGSPTPLFLIVNALTAILVTTLTAPFTAALTVLLYVDRRIRREGLDIELARAAGVSIPGRTPPPPTPAGPLP